MVGFVRDLALNDRGCFASLAMTEVAAVTARPKAAAVLELFLQIASPVCFVAMLLAMTKCFAMTGLFDMQATLFGSLIFPPPATSAEVLA